MERILSSVILSSEVTPGYGTGTVGSFVCRNDGKDGHGNWLWSFSKVVVAREEIVGMIMVASSMMTVVTVQGCLCR